MDDLYLISIDTLEMAFDIAKKEGMRFVYLGNVGGINTRTPIARSAILCLSTAWGSGSAIKIKDGKCPECGEEIPMVGLEKK